MDISMDRFDPIDTVGNNSFIPFWTQMTRLNKTHFHNHTSIFNQFDMFHMPDFQDQVISNLHGKLRLVLTPTSKNCR